VARKAGKAWSIGHRAKSKKIEVRDQRSEVRGKTKEFRIAGFGLRIWDVRGGIPFTVYHLQFIQILRVLRVQRFDGLNDRRLG
jgi:hypothetical protein